MNNSTDSLFPRLLRLLNRRAHEHFCAFGSAVSRGHRHRHPGHVHRLEGLRGRQPHRTSAQPEVRHGEDRRHLKPQPGWGHRLGGRQDRDRDHLPRRAAAGCKRFGRCGRTFRLQHHQCRLLRHRRPLGQCADKRPAVRAGNQLPAGSGRLRQGRRAGPYRQVPRYSRG